jgi:hypothetical protein
MNKVILAGLMLVSQLAVGQTFSYQRNDTIVVTKNGQTMLYPWAGGMNSMHFGRVDIDLDGIEDLVAFDRTVDKILTFRNLGIADSISYVYAPEYEKSFPHLSQWMKLEDYNCDGKKDIFSWTPGGIKVFRNTSTAALSFVLVEDLIYSYQFPNNLNLYVSSVDVPGIHDIDNDGDLDVLTFGVFGSTMEYHRNLSMELYGVCDSLKFEMKNMCWGGFLESASSNSVELQYVGWPCTTGNVSNPESQLDDNLADLLANTPESTEIINAMPKHSGSTILVFDVDSNGVKDLVLGDVSFSNLVMLQNGGTVVNMNTMMTYQDSLYPVYDIPADVFIFPAAFYEDVNNDGVRDMLVSTNSSNLSVDKESVWLYMNERHTDFPEMHFAKTNFLQDDMIEHGTGAAPVLFDYDADGLKDLLVANMGTFDRMSFTYKPFIALYRNTGTATTPQFDLITEDFENLSTSGLPIGLHPAFGDVDNDGDADMIIGDADGNLHYFQNVAGAGNTADFVLAVPMMADQSATVIDVGNYATPVLVDIDRDGDLDIVSGARSGTLTFVKNKGSVSSPLWEVTSTNFGGVDVREWFELPNGAGYSVPCIVDNSGNHELYLGSKSGYIHFYDQIDGNLSGSFNRVDTTFDDIFIGQRSAITFGELDADGRNEIVVGNYRGGVACFDYYINQTTIAEQQVESFVYPNPTDGVLYISLPVGGTFTGTLTLHDQTGRLCMSAPWQGGQRMMLDVSQLAKGVYVLGDEDSRMKPVRIILQ